MGRVGKGFKIQVLAGSHVKDAHLHFVHGTARFRVTDIVDLRRVLQVVEDRVELHHALVHPVIGQFVALIGPEGAFVNPELVAVYVVGAYHHAGVGIIAHRHAFSGFGSPDIQVVGHCVGYVAAFSGNIPISGFGQGIPAFYLLVGQVVN